MSLISRGELQSALRKHPDWREDGNAIKREYEFRDFAEAMGFVNRVADAAEAANHHPDISISYNRVTLALTSHDSGGVTDRDLRMAAKIDELRP